MTATCCTPRNALTLLTECGVEHECLQIGALRSYLTISKGNEGGGEVEKKE